MNQLGTPVTNCYKFTLFAAVVKTILSKGPATCAIVLMKDTNGNAS